MSHKRFDSRFFRSLFVILSTVSLLVACGGDGGGGGSTDYVANDTAATGESVYLHVYSVNDSETIITEDDTGVMWQKSGGWIPMTWDEANAYCEELVLEGYDDWELPELDLLKELFERDAYAYQ